VDAVKKFLKGPRGEASEIKAELDDLVRRIERVRSRVGRRLAVELSPAVIDLLRRAGRREVAAVGAKLHPAQA
jgi:hypothetical protein